MAETVQRLAGPGPGRCLDLGCGTGFHLPTLLELGWTVTGVDISEDQLRIARDRAGARAELLQADAADLPFDDGTFEAKGVPALHPGNRERGRYTDAPGISPAGLRAKVGAVHLPLGELLQTFLSAGLRVEAFEEPIGEDREYPHRLALRATR